MTTRGTHAETMLDEARSAHQRGDATTALSVVTRALKRGETAEAWGLKGDIHTGLGQFPAAAEAFGQAVRLAPSHPIYTHDLGRSLLQSQRAAEAEPVLARAAVLTPRAWDVHCDLGTAQLDQGRFAEAVASFDRATALDAQAYVAHANRGLALQELGRHEDAETAFRNALRLQPNFLPAVMSLANLTADFGNRAEAEELFARGRAIAPKDLLFAQSHALVKLRYGELHEGFALYETRFLPSRFGVAARPFQSPRWQGEDLRDRDILLWTEQGLGDEILSASLIPEIVAAARSCTIECSDRVAPLFARSFPQAKVVMRRDPPDERLQRQFDFQSPAMSLAQFSRREMAAFPKHAGYLRADSDLVEQLRAKYRAVKPGARVIGIAWDSTARHGSRKRLPLQEWHPILGTPDSTFVSLQYGVRSGSTDVAALKDRILVDDEIDALRSLDASAAQVAAMDQVITVSNTTAHLAGAQNIPVWTLLPGGPGCFWYWFRDRAESPWYPSMRLFRQPSPGDWRGVVEKIATALVEHRGASRL